MATKVRGARPRPGRPLGPAAARGGSGPGARAAAPPGRPRGRAGAHPAPAGLGLRGAGGWPGLGRPGARLAAREGLGAGPRPLAAPSAKFAPERGPRPPGERGEVPAAPAPAPGSRLTAGSPDSFPSGVYSSPPRASGRCGSSVPSFRRGWDPGATGRFRGPDPRRGGLRI